MIYPLMWSKTCDIAKYMGVKYVLNQCIGEACIRTDHPNDVVGVGNGRCSWRDEVLILDEVLCPDETDHGKITMKAIPIPARWYNFQYAILEIMQKKTPQKDLEVTKEDILAACSLVEKRCLDIYGKPKYLPEGLDFSSYQKLLRFVEDSWSALDFKTAAFKE